jgi:cyclopropane fatty-acyl-phospholipid synthase-like methyltransferase
LGINTAEHSQENIKKILDWSIKTFDSSIKDKTPYFLDFKVNKHYPDEIKKTTDNNKFKSICDICQIKPGMKILELGFGEGDFINYIKTEYNINVTGVSISDEQVKLIKSRGFNGYKLNHWDMTPEVIGTYDLIIHCGALEYIMCTGESHENYVNYCNIIKQLLNENGKYFVTCIHFNEKFGNYSLYDNINAYFLWSGNDGSYPLGADGFTKYAEKSGLKVIKQHERTNDYFITTILYMSFLRCSKNNKCVNMFYLNDFLIALFKTIAAPYYLHTYICYAPTNDFYWLPWQWEFIPQYKNGQYVSPVTLQYILFQK